MTAVLADKILVFLRRELAVRGDIGEHTSLLASGLIDSAGLVRLAALLERETGRTIPDKDLTADHFDTIASILAYLDKTPTV
jgi:acyl carrier protein